jgi:dephospho-CoA kinase
MALTIGITGSIGSGKSTVCSVFKLLGAPVFEADRVAKRLINKNDEVKAGLIRQFGENIYGQDGTVNRKKLAEIVFNDEIQLSKINELVHPLVQNEFLKWSRHYEHLPYIVHEAAILFESGFYKMMNYTIMVAAPEKQRIQRVMKRDGVSEKKVRKRMKNQFSEEKKQKMANFVLINDNTHLIIPKIIEIDKNLKRYGKIW